MLINLMGGILSQCRHISNHHLYTLIILQFYLSIIPQQSCKKNAGLPVKFYFQIKKE